jgi:peptide/nickel transport system permease protein
MRRYFGRKLLVYGLTFFFAVTINWLIPRMMPGDPVQNMIARQHPPNPEAAERMRSFYRDIFGLDTPVWQQYLNFWKSVLRGDLGVSTWVFPEPVTRVILGALPYTLALMVPAILLSFWAGNKFGALAARRKWLDNAALPFGYVLTATPYMWLAILLIWLLGQQADIFPTSGSYSFALRPAWSWTFLADLVLHWFLPFSTLFLVAFGGWAIGMRNMIIYELEADYCQYLESLGAPKRLVRRYAYRNALLPQLTGLALQLGVLVAGALVTEIAFGYRGLGRLIFEGIKAQDYFLIQGIFLFIVIGVLIANFVIDIVYVLVDPRTRAGMQGEPA